MQCNHQEEAKLLTVKKEGENQGRQFYACARPRGEQCDFFEWAGEQVPKSPITPGIQIILDRIAQLENNLMDVLKRGTVPLENVDKGDLPF